MANKEPPNPDDARESDPATDPTTVPPSEGHAETVDCVEHVSRIAWSPECTRVAVSGDESGQVQVRVVDILPCRPGTEPREQSLIESASRAYAVLTSGFLRSRLSTIEEPRRGAACARECGNRGVFGSGHVIATELAVVLFCLESLLSSKSSIFGWISRIRWGSLFSGK